MTLQGKALTEVRQLLKSVDTYQVYSSMSRFLNDLKIESKPEIMDALQKLQQVQYDKVKEALAWVEVLIENEQ